MHSLAGPRGEPVWPFPASGLTWITYTGVGTDIIRQHRWHYSWFLPFPHLWRGYHTEHHLIYIYICSCANQQKHIPGKTQQTSHDHNLYGAAAIKLGKHPLHPAAPILASPDMCSNKQGEPGWFENVKFLREKARLGAPFTVHGTFSRWQQQFLKTSLMMFCPVCAFADKQGNN